MKKKFLTTVSLILCALMIFTACGNKNEKPSDEGTIPKTYVPLVDNSQAMIVVVRPDNSSDTEKEAAMALKGELSELLGTTVAITIDWGFDTSKYPSGTYFVCVGNTALDISKELTADKTYEMYGVKAEGNMIAVSATNSAYLELATKQFLKAIKSVDGVYYLDTASLDYDSGEITTATVIDGKTTEYTVVYENTKTLSDYPAVLANTVVSAFKDSYGVDIPAKDDHAQSYGKEIIIGSCQNRDVISGLTDDLLYNEFVIKLLDNGNIVIIGKNDETTRLGAEKFIEMVKAQAKSGTFKFASVLSGKYTAEGMPNVPLFENSTDFELISSVLGSSAMYYKDTSAERYENYLKELEKSGFELVVKNKIKDNIFATYQNDEAIINCYFTAYDKSLRVCVDSKETTALHNYEPKETKSVTTPMLIQYTSGCGYIIRLKDGTFVIYDSGMSNDIVYKNLYDSLNKYNVTGTTPVVRAWIYSHPHVDHVGGFFKFCESYANSIIVKQFVFNNPTRTHYEYTIDDPPNGDEILEDRIFKFLEYCEKYYPSADIVTAHTGQIMYFGDMKTEILHTHEDDYPTHLKAGNQISVLARFTIDDQTLLLTGDMHQTSAPIIVSMFGSHLRSDILQIPHHGYNGGTAEFYKTIKAQTLLYTNNLEAYQTNKNKNSVNTAVSAANQILVPVDENDIIAVELPYQASFGAKWNRK